MVLYIGDPPKGAINWEQTPGGLAHAIDLVKFIREEFGDYFCIACAGFPEGHPSNKEEPDDVSLLHLKEKVVIMIVIMMKNSSFI